MADRKVAIGDYVDNEFRHQLWTPGDKLIDPDGNPLGGGGGGGVGWLSEGVSDDMLDHNRHDEDAGTGYWRTNKAAGGGRYHRLLASEGTGYRIANDWSEQGFLLSQEYPELTRLAPCINTLAPQLYDIEVTFSPASSRHPSTGGGEWNSYLAHIFYERGQGYENQWGRRLLPRNSFITGYASGTLNSTTVNGVGTLFTQELRPGDHITIRNPAAPIGGGSQYHGLYTVSKIINDTQLIIDGYPRLLFAPAGTTSNGIWLFFRPIMYAVTMNVYAAADEPPRIKEVDFSVISDARIGQGPWSNTDGGPVRTYEPLSPRLAIPGEPTSLRIRMKASLEPFRFKAASPDKVNYIYRLSFGYHDGSSWKHIISFVTRGSQVEQDPAGEGDPAWLYSIHEVSPDFWSEMPMIDMGIECPDGDSAAENRITDFKWASTQEWDDRPALPI